MGCRAAQGTGRQWYLTGCRLGRARADDCPFGLGPKDLSRCRWGGVDITVCLRLGWAAVLRAQSVRVMSLPPAGQPSPKLLPPAAAPNEKTPVQPG